MVREPNQGNFLTPVSILIHILRRGFLNLILVWDFRTGVVLSKLGVDWGQKIAFSGTQQIVSFNDFNSSLITINIYDTLKGTLPRYGQHSTSGYGRLGDYWIHEGCLRSATSSKKDGKCVVIIREFQPTSNRPDPVVGSFPVPPHDGVFSFSSVSFHASFVTETEVVILDVRNSETLLREKARQPFYRPQGYFSPNGHFFACGTRGQDIFVWKNTPTGYVHWSTITPRLQFLGFSFSPAAVSILTWGPGKIQLLHLEAHDVASPNKFHNGSENHLVTHSTDRTRIATVRRGKGVITVLDSHSGDLQQSIDTGMLIQDIKIVSDAIFVTDGHKLVNWHLKPGLAHNVRNARKGTVDMTLFNRPVPCSALSNDCSKIAFAGKEGSFAGTMGSLAELPRYVAAERKTVVTICNINAPNTAVPNNSRHYLDLYMHPHLLNARLIDTHTINPRVAEYGHDVLNIRFSLDERRMLLITGNVSSASCSLELGLTEDWRIGDVIEDGTDPWSRTDSYSSDGCHVGGGSQWVMDSRHRKLLWLPPSWRTLFPYDIQWIGNSLILLSGVHPEPIIIEF